MEIEKVKANNIQVGSTTSPVQIAITTPDGVYFQSYATTIAFRRYSDGKIFLDKENWNKSNTTGKYRNQFLGENSAETQKKIKSGQYILTDLN